MAGKGITAELIISTATQLVRERGYGNYTARDLAARLEIKAASLYKHVDSMDEVNKEICRRSAVRMWELLSKACEGKTRGDAVIAVGEAFRNFARTEPALYHAVLGLPALTDDREFLEYGRNSFTPIRDAIAQYNLPRSIQIHFARCYRAALSGFVAQQESGYFTNTALDTEESFRFMLEGYVSWAESLEQGCRNL